MHNPLFGAKVIISLLF